MPEKKSDKPFPVKVDRNVYPRPEYRFPDVKVGLTYQDSAADFPKPLAATVLVFLSLAEVILTAGLVRREREGLARKIDRVSRVLFPLTFTVVAVLALVA